MTDLKGFTRVASLVTGLASLAAIVLLLLYVRNNDSGHTGINPYLALAVFVPTLACGAANLAANRGCKKNLLTGIIPVLAGGSGTALLIYLDKANVLLPYETWIRRGMP